MGTKVGTTNSPVSEPTISNRIKKFHFFSCSPAWVHQSEVIFLQHTFPEWSMQTYEVRVPPFDSQLFLRLMSETEATNHDCVKVIVLVCVRFVSFREASQTYQRVVCALSALYVWNVQRNAAAVTNVGLLFLHAGQFCTR